MITINTLKQASKFVRDNGMIKFAITVRATGKSHVIESRPDPLEMSVAVCEFIAAHQLEPTDIELAVMPRALN